MSAKNARGANAVFKYLCEVVDFTIASSVRWYSFVAVLHVHTLSSHISCACARLSDVSRMYAYFRIVYTLRRAISCSQLNVGFLACAPSGMWKYSVKILLIGRTQIGYHESSLFIVETAIRWVS